MVSPAAEGRYDSGELVSPVLQRYDETGSREPVSFRLLLRGLGIRGAQPNMASAICGTIVLYWV